MTKALGRFEDGAALDLDIDKLVGTHLCIQGNSGAGKSGAIRRLLEATHGRVQHIVLDVEDEFYTLREKFDYLIAGGDNGDCAANVNNAAALAIMLLETGFSAVVQINELHIEERREFIALFLDALIGAPKALWHPALVVLDEAQMYAPQVGTEASSAAVVSLMTLGRKRGFTGVLATPRISSISKDATGPVNNWLMGRVGQPTDRRTTADALGFRANSDEARGLMKLTTRSFWAFGPALSLEPQLLRIEDAETTVIRAGMAAVPTPPAPAAMQKLLAQLNAAAKAAEAAPATPKVPTSGSGVKPPPDAAAAIATAKAEGYAEGYARGKEAGIYMGRLRELEDAFQASATALQALRDDEDAEQNKPEPEWRQAADKEMLASMRQLRGAEADRSGIATPAKPKVKRPPLVDGALPQSALALLGAFGRYDVRGLTWDEAAIVAGMRAAGGYFYGGKRPLLDGGYVEERAAGRFQIAGPGAALVATGVPAKRSELVTSWGGKLKNPAGKILQVLAGASKKSFEPGELADAVGCKPAGGYWYGGLRPLLDIGLIENDGKSFKLGAFLAEAK